MPASPLVTFLLRSLKHPRPHDVDPDDPMQFQETVVWLEGSRIRHYKEGERAALQHGDPQLWQAALQKYLIDVECPIEFDGANRSAVLHWLLTHAVEAEYHEHKDQLKQATHRFVSEAAAPEDWCEDQLPPLPDIMSDTVRASLQQLLTLLHADPSSHPTSSSSSPDAPPGATPEALLRARTMLEACVLPALAELEKQQQQQQQQQQRQQALGDGCGGGGSGSGGDAPVAAATQQSAVTAMLAQYPLGFATGEPGADVAATVLRMLYIKDLRALQTQVDTAIVQVQELTANPQIDGSMGKVGR
ncbi:RNA transcription [Chlorella vulgaris]